MLLHSDILEDCNFGRKALRREIIFGCSATSLDEQSNLRDNASHKHPTHLKLMMLGCEENRPYGPTDHTATMFLNFICQALEDSLAARASELSTKTTFVVSITIYRVQRGEYPQSSEEWDWYNGILLPGSFSSAYDSDSWIDVLSQVIQSELYGRRRPTLGVCFGHQLYAHSFSNGKAAKVPAGPQGGRKAFKTTPEGKRLLLREMLDLYYTHGDMVHTLPHCAVSLGGNECVPIQAAAYYPDDSTEDEATKQPIAITFQSHPEYAAAPSTLQNILEAMGARGDLTIDDRIQAAKDAERYFDDVKRQSLDVMIACGKLLGWFPSD